MIPDDRSPDNVYSYGMLPESKLAWWPYRTFSKVFLHTMRGSVAQAKINGRLADQLREILLREQGRALDLSEKLMKRQGNGAGPSKSEQPAEAFDEFFDGTIGEIRQAGQALVEAQICSIEALREHVKQGSTHMQKSAQREQVAE